MRLILFVFLLIFTAQAEGQNNFQENNFNNSRKRFFTDSSRLNKINPQKKWFVSKYMGMSTGISFFNGGQVTIFAAPIGLQLNRRLNNNWYAFAGLSATPAYVSFNNAFLSSNKNNYTNGNFNSGTFNIYPKAQMGLMYINDQKTFSISGSVSIEKSNYQLAPNNQFGTAGQNMFIPALR